MGFIYHLTALGILGNIHTYVYPFSYTSNAVQVVNYARGRTNRESSWLRNTEPAAAAVVSPRCLLPHTLVLRPTWMPVEGVARNEGDARGHSGAAAKGGQGRRACGEVT